MQWRIGRRLASGGWQKHPGEGKRPNIVNNAVRDGRLIPWPVCAVPGAHRNRRHHPDYSHPLDVVWLCDKHHRSSYRACKEKAA